MQDLFVYGTLQFPVILRKLTGKSFESQPAILANFKRHCVKNCDYPAIIENQGSITTGLLLMNVDDDSLRAIDYFEGVEYKKQEVSVTIDGKNVAAYVYVWNSDKELLEEKEWDTDFFEKNFLQLYIG